MGRGHLVTNTNKQDNSEFFLWSDYSPLTPGERLQGWSLGLRPQSQPCPPTRAGGGRHVCSSRSRPALSGFGAGESVGARQPLLLPPPGVWDKCGWQSGNGSRSGGDMGQVSRSLCVTVKRGPSRSLILLVRVIGPPQVPGRGPEAWIPGDERLGGPDFGDLRGPEAPAPLQWSPLQIWDAEGPRFRWR